MSSELFRIISNSIKKKFTSKFIKEFKTKLGNTQVSERNVISAVKNILLELNLNFEEAGSQQSKDFRNVGEEKINIEIKKTDGFTIMFNDTCPSEKIFYVIFFTGKEYKKTPEKNIPGKLLFMNGEEFVKDSPWIEDYIRDITALKDKYGRGENKKLLEGIMEVYPRPTFKADISKFLGVENDDNDNNDEKEQEVPEEP